MEPLSGKSSLKDTNNAFADFNSLGQVTLKSSSGPTDSRVVIARDGSLTSNVAEWLMEAKSFEITGASILFSAFIFSIIFGFLIGSRSARMRRDEFLFNHKDYAMSGVAQIQDNGKTLYMPVYEVKP